MRCALCESKHDLHRLMPPGRCDDCTMATPFSDQLCLDCSTKTARCQTCKSSKVEHGDASDLSQQPDISSDIPRQSPTSMLKMDLLRAVFIRYTNPDSNCISQTQFRKLVSHLPLSNRTAAIVKADLAFLQVATVRGRNLQFLEFVNAIGRFSKSIYRASLAHSLDSICNNCLSSMLLTGTNTIESPPGGHAAVADLLAQNRQVLKCVYVDACGSSLRLTLDGFMSFCRSTGILPEVATVAELKHVFLGCRGSEDTSAKFAEFCSMLAAVAGGVRFNLQVLLLRITEHLPGTTRRLVAIRDSSESQLPTTVTWTRSYRTIVENVFDFYCRRDDSGGHEKFTISSSTLLRFVSDYNQTAPAKLQIRKSHAVVALARFKRECRVVSVSLDLFALFLEWHASCISQTDGATITESLGLITAVIQTVYLNNADHPARLRPSLNPLHDPTVCSILLEHEPRIRLLYGEFVTVPGQGYSGLRLGQCDLDKMCVSTAIVPNLLTARKVVWISHHIRAARTRSSEGPLDMDEFLEAIARMAMEAFSEGIVLGRRCEQQSISDRLLLFLLFLDTHREGSLLSRGSATTLHIPIEEQNGAVARKLQLEREIYRQLESETCILKHREEIR